MNKNETNLSLRITERAHAMLGELQREHGEGLLFVLSGGCCDGTLPMLLKDFHPGVGDPRIGEVDGVGVYATREQVRLFDGYLLEIDLVEGGGGSSFSLEIARRARFILTSRRALP